MAALPVGTSSGSGAFAASMDDDGEPFAEPKKVKIPFEQVQTPLARAIRAGDGSTVERLTTQASASTLGSVFVQGYSQNSLICTLPMAEQSPSSVVDWPPPLTNVDPQILSQLDAALAEYISRKAQVEHAEMVKSLGAPSGLHTVTIARDKLHAPLGLILHLDANQEQVVLVDEPAHDNLQGVVRAGDVLVRVNDHLCLLNNSVRDAQAAITEGISKGELTFTFWSPSAATRKALSHGAGGASASANASAHPVGTSHAGGAAAAAAATATATAVGGGAAHKGNAGAAATATTTTPFDHYGPIKVGDFVYRGSHWNDNNDDMLSGKRVIGKVTEVINNGDAAKVEWSSSASSFVSCKGRGTYKYEKANNFFELFRVDPQNPHITASNLNFRAPPVSERLKVGDIVRLMPTCTQSSCVTSGNTALSLSSDACLGNASANRLGVIVRVLPQQFAYKGKMQRALAPGEVDSLVVVMSLDNSKLCLYPMSDLRFGDGTLPGPAPAPPPVALTPPSQSTQSSSTTSFKTNDVVRLHPRARDLRGCLGKPEYGFIAYVKDPSNSGGVHVFSEESYGTPLQSNLDMPNHVYSPSDLILDSPSGAAGGSSRDEVALQVGDRVVLSDSFAENGGDGWCLGRKADKKVGIVVFAAPLSPAPAAGLFANTASSNSTPNGQRDVVVVSEDDTTTRPFSFKACWLQRAPIRTHSFRVGDRVQLSVGVWLANSAAAASLTSSPGSQTAADAAHPDKLKCLGEPSDFLVGVVCMVGEQRDGHQRNVVVQAISGPHVAQKSLYSSSALTPSHRATTLFMQDSDLLKEELLVLLADTFAASSVVQTFGLAGFCRAHEILTKADPSKHDVVLAAFYRWMAKRPAHVPDGKVAREILRSLDGKAAPFAVSSSTSGPVALSAQWTCSRCPVTTNLPNVPKCKGCNNPAPLWTCRVCSCSNPAWSLGCGACHVTKDVSDALPSVGDGQQGKQPAQGAPAAGAAAAAAAPSSSGSRVPCKFFNTPGGCRHGTSCGFAHESPPADGVAAAADGSAPAQGIAAPSKTHTGEWRAVDERPPFRYSANGDKLAEISIYCGEDQRPSEGMACAHQGGSIHSNHWSCCGGLDRSTTTCGLPSDRMKLGDFVKLSAQAQSGYSSLRGQIMIISKDDHSGNPYKVTTTDGKMFDNWFRPHELVRATKEEEVKERAERAKRGVVDIGSSVQLSAECTRTDLPFSHNDVVEIVENDGSSNPFRVRFNGSVVGTWIERRHLMPADLTALKKRQEQLLHVVSLPTAPGHSSRLKGIDECRQNLTAPKARLSFGGLARLSLSATPPPEAQGKSGKDGDGGASAAPAPGKVAGPTAAAAASGAEEGSGGDPLADLFDFGDLEAVGVSHSSVGNAGAVGGGVSSVAGAWALSASAELDRNTELIEQYSTPAAAVPAPAATAPAVATSSNGESESEGFFRRRSGLARSTSVEYYAGDIFRPVDTVRNLCRFVDRNGNSAAHHAAFMDFRLTFRALAAAGASMWLENKNQDTPWVVNFAKLTGVPVEHARAHQAILKKLFVHGFLSPLLLPSLLKALTTSACAAHMDEIPAAIKSGDEDRAKDLLQAWEQKEEKDGGGHPSLLIYHALFLLHFDHGDTLARPLVAQYEEKVATLSATQGGSCVALAPEYFLVRYWLWKRVPSNRNPSFAKKDRVAAALAVQTLRLFPEVAELWIDATDNIDDVCIKQYPGYIDSVPNAGGDDEDDYSSLIPPPGPDDPETLWELEKSYHNITSPAMDKLMKLTGLKQVKKMAIQVATKVLLRPPPDLATSTSMNFLFVGNPGCGKTTVANLLATAMVELQYRQNPTPVIVSAGDILASKDPGQEFSQMVQQAAGGTLFIDEAYLFDPAPKGSRANDSNRVLDILMQVSETMRDTTTFILAGYKEDIMALLSYNPGFPSRFPKVFTFEFQDYTEAQLCQILCTKVKERGYRLESTAACGVPIARIMAQRMHRGAQKKGFGNGRLVEKTLEQCLIAQQGRLGKMMLRNVPISDRDYRTLLRVDTVGERPRLDNSQAFRDLNNMVGLENVKTELRSFMELQLQNYDAEIRSDTVQRVSLNRVFYGNPGTGKTTVAKYYGLLLKEFGFLSDGDIIIVSPSDLMGQAQGEAAVLTKKYLQDAAGKVLFIDEAYGLDPKRSGNTYAGAVLDTLVEKIDGSSTADICVIMAGYRPQMEDLFRNCNNPGLIRRMNLEQALSFADYTDAELRMVLKRMVSARGLCAYPSTLDFAVKLMSKKRKMDGFPNAAEAAMSLDRATLKLSARKSAQKGVHPTLLIDQDFVGEENSVEEAFKVFEDMENMEHVLSLLRRREALLKTAKMEGKDPAKIMETSHMIFVGPPGTGKSTAAAKFGKVLRNMDLIARDHVEVVQGSHLIDRYVGGTTNNVLAAMRRAKNGVLFIDEIYALGNSTYGMEALQALLDNITAPEFQGKIIVIFAGYKAEVERLFTVNPGLQGRFDKVRIDFPEWTAEMASRALIHAIEKDGKSLTQECRDCLPQLFDALRSQPNWASARDVFDLVLPGMLEAHAVRYSAASDEQRQLGLGEPTLLPRDFPYEADDARGVLTELIARRGGGVAAPIKSKTAFAEAMESTRRNGKLMVAMFSASWNPRSKACQSPFLALQQEYPQVVFKVIDYDNAELAQAFRVTALPTFCLVAGGKVLGERASTVEDTQTLIDDWLRTHGPEERKNPGAGEDGEAALRRPKENVKVRILERKLEPDEEDRGDDDADWWAALEEACAAMGMTLEQIQAMLESADFPSAELLGKMKLPSGVDADKVRAMMRRQRPAVLSKIKESIQEAKRKKSAEEEAILAKVRKIGRCPMGFEWIKIDGGYRCGGGSHMVSDMEIQNFMVDS